MKKAYIIAIIIVCLSAPMGVRARVVGGGDLTYTPMNASPVVFSHNKHVEVIGLGCNNCHYRLFTMARESHKMDMDSMNKGDFCGHCHNGRNAFDVKDKNNCTRCHR
jgi:c(7)-type cytochrome triheme protein